MGNRYFHLRLNTSYEGSENKVKDLDVEVLHDNQWEPLHLDIRSPGFLLFINGLFSCQHLYMRTNAAERDIVLNRARGEMKVIASDNWAIEDVEVWFKAVIESGTVTDQAHAYIIDRMHHCPVSTNLPAHLTLRVSVEFD